MRVLLHRVLEARVTVAGAKVGEIGPGLLALVCAMPGDSDEAVDKMAARVARLRIFRDDQGRMNLPVSAAGNAVLAISQFTLAADTKGGNRPSFTAAAAPDEGRRLYNYFVDQARAAHPVVQTGEFAADMQVHLVNDGPVTIPMRMEPPAQ